jgi:hypothetical protein
VRTTTLEDPAAEHQIILRRTADTRPYRNGLPIIMSCTCRPYLPQMRPGGRRRHEPIEARTRFPAADAIAAWRAWHVERGVVV